MRKLVLVPLLFLVGAAIFLLSAQKPAFEYFTIQCKVLDRAGHILFYKPGYDLCAYSPDGKLLASKPEEDKLVLLDSDDTELWSSTEHVHHDLKFSEDFQKIMVITSEVIDFRGEKLRGDCFSVRDLQNHLLHSWCLGPHLQELQKMGFRFDFPELVARPNQSRLAYPSRELSHANSFFRIGANKLAASNPAFTEGNYLINLYEPSFAALVLDSNLEKILWACDFSRFKLGPYIGELHTHDLQITNEGRMLIYANNFVPNSEGDYSFLPLFIRPLNLWPVWASQLLEIDPETGNVLWIYRAASPTEFRAPRLGSVTRLENAHYLYSDASTVGEFFEITPEGKKVWQYSLEKPADGRFRHHAPSVRPLTDKGFLKARGLL